MRLVTVICCVIVFTFKGYSQDEEEKPPPPRAEQTYQINENLQYVYQKPKLFGFITHIPKNYVNLGKESVKKENLKWLGLTAASTVLLFISDERSLDAAENLRNLGIQENHNFGTALGVLPYPKSTSSALYYLGHGNTSLSVGAGLLIFGGLKKDYRAIQTSSEILEGILTLGVLTQGLKRVLGRESPYVRTEPRGNWAGFPGWSEYAKNTPHYDAMPSGHMATITSTITILAKNYPEVKWIRPVGYSLMGVLGLEMMNSGVHWASDYPLGILIGYAVGTVVTNSRIKKIKTDNYSNHKKGFNTNLTYNNVYGDNLIGVVITF